MQSPYKYEAAMQEEEEEESVSRRGANVASYWAQTMCQ
jgi:hypothetical protein